MFLGEFFILDRTYGLPTKKHSRGSPVESLDPDGDSILGKSSLEEVKSPGKILVPELFTLSTSCHTVNLCAPSSPCHNRP